MRISIAAAALIIAATIACSSDNQPNLCGMPAPGVVISPGIDFIVRDTYGRGQAIGTTAVIHGPNNVTETRAGSDTLNIFAAFSQTGTYSATLSRAFYQDLTVANITATPGACGSVNRATVPVVLQLQPDAPPLRALVLIGGEFLDHPGAQVKLIPHFDADPGVSTAVQWSVDNATLASVDANGVVTAKCVTAGGTVKVTALALADGKTTGTLDIGISPASTCP
jgi:hypothetical protein